MGLALAMTLAMTSQPEPSPDASAPASDQVVSGYGQSIEFAGYSWLTKIATQPVGPGPNYFSDGPDTVWVDEEGRLHLRLAPGDNGAWYAAEVVCTASFGYGTYQFLVDSPVDSLDPNVVLGLFTWDDDPAQNHRELDIEFARFGAPSSPAGRYTVQPYQQAGNVFGFRQPPVSESLHMFMWSAAAVTFESAAGDLIAQHVFTSDIPSPGNEHARMNLWLDRGYAPTDGQPVEIVIRDFTFISAE